MSATLLNLTSVGGLHEPDGSNANGTIKVQYTTPILNSNGSQVIGNDPIIFTVTNGAIVGTPKVYATNDPSTQPQGVLAIVTITLATFTNVYSTVIPYDSPGGNWDISQIVPPPVNMVTGFDYASKSDIRNLFTDRVGTATLGAAQTVDMRAFQRYDYTMTQNCTITPASVVKGNKFSMTLRGPWVPTFSGVTWTRGITPVYADTSDYDFWCVLDGECRGVQH